MKNKLFAAVFCASLTGCASIFSGTTTDISIRTTPGASYTVTNGYGNQVVSGVVGEDAEARVNLMRGAGYFKPHSYKMRLSKPGYKPATLSIDPGMNGWYFANLAIGGFVGMVIVDPLTGGMWRMIPTTDVLTLEPTGEDVAKIEQRSAYIKAANNYPISKHEYTAIQSIKPLGCKPVATPELFVSANQETMIFQCEDSRKVAVNCSIEGCSVSK